MGLDRFVDGCNLGSAVDFLNLFAVTVDASLMVKQVKVVADGQILGIDGVLEGSTVVGSGL